MSSDILRHMRVILVMDDGLVGRIDEARGDVPRAAWIRRACEKELFRIADEAASRAASQKSDRIVLAYETRKDGSVVPTYHPVVDEEGPRDKEDAGRSARAHGYINVETVPVPCQCGGMIFQAGSRKGQCTKCSKPRPA